MSSATDEQILKSFLDDDESLRSTATVDAVQRGFTTTPPQLEDSVTVGVTDRRLLWFDEELDTIERSAIESVERDSVSHRSAPTVVRVGSFAMIAGIVAGLVGGLVGGLSLPVSLGLVAGGIAVFAATLALARVRGDTASGFEKHRLTVETDDQLIQLWGTDDALATVESELTE